MPERWPGLPRPPHRQAPRATFSLRYPPDPRKVHVDTLADVAREVAQCPECWRSQFCIPWQGQLIGWEEARALLPKAKPEPATCPKLERIRRLAAESMALPSRWSRRHG